MHLFGITKDAPRLGDVTLFLFTYNFWTVVIFHTHILFNLQNPVLHTLWMGKMHSDGPLKEKKIKKPVFGFLRRKRSGKFHISPEVNEFERLSSLPPPHTSPVPIYRNTPVKIKNYYLSESTVNIMSKLEAGTPDLTLNTNTTNNTKVPPKEDSHFIFSAAFDSSPQGFENRKAVPLQRSGSLHKSRSMGAIRDKSRPFESSPTRNEPVKPDHSPTEAKKSPKSASEPLSNDGLDHEELLQAEYNKLFQIGREIGYDDDEVRQWVDYVLEHGLPNPKAGSEMNSENIETEVDCNNARVPEFTQRDFAVKEIERHYLQDVFGEDTISTRRLFVDNRYTPDVTAAPSGQHSIYIHGNSDIASHATLKACCHDPPSSSFSSAASPSLRLAAPKIEHSIVADICGGDDRSAPPDADPLWFRADMDSGEFQDPPEIGTKAEDTGDREQELKARTNTVDSKGLIPLLLPLRHNKASSTLHKRTRNAPIAASAANSSVPRKLHDVGQSSSFSRGRGLRTFSNLAYKEDDNLAQATGKPVPLDRTRKEQLSEATATLANLADCRTSTDSCSVYTYGSLIDSLNDKQSEAAHLSGIASETSNSYPDSPTLGYSHPTTPSTTPKDIYIPPSSQFIPRYVPSRLSSANDEMKMPHKNVGSEGSKASSRDVNLPSPYGTFSESSFSSRCEEANPSTKWDEEMRYANEKACCHSYSTTFVWILLTDILLQAPSP